MRWDIYKSVVQNTKDNMSPSGQIVIDTDLYSSVISAIAQIDNNGQEEYVFLPTVYCGILNSIHEELYEELYNEIKEN